MQCINHLQWNNEWQRKKYSNDWFPIKTGVWIISVPMKSYHWGRIHLSISALISILKEMGLSVKFILISES